MSYATESDVYDNSGLTTTIVQLVTGKSEADVTTLINGFLTKATGDVKEDLGINLTIHRELHLGDGESNIFSLGPEDERQYFDYDVEDNLDRIRRVWFGYEKKKLPYPKDCDLTETIAALCGNSNCTITDETTTFKAGVNSTKLVFSSSGYMEYPSAQDLNLLIDQFPYVSFWLRTDDASITFTLRLYDKDGNNNEYAFTLDKANVWYDVHLKIDDFDTANIDWETVRLYYFRLYASAACTAYLDNFNFNDGWMFTAPEGLFIVSVDGDNSGDEAPTDGEPFFLSYTYDPFKSSTPSYIEEATALKAGIKLIDHLRGKRYADTFLKLRIEPNIMNIEGTGTPYSLMAVRTKLEERYKECLNKYGFEGSYGVIL